MLEEKTTTTKTLFKSGFGGVQHPQGEHILHPLVRGGFHMFPQGHLSWGGVHPVHQSSVARAYRETPGI